VPGFLLCWREAIDCLLLDVKEMIEIWE